jgi:hypothetical protein
MVPAAITDIRMKHNTINTDEIGSAQLGGHISIEGSNNGGSSSVHRNNWKDTSRFGEQDQNTSLE